MAETERDRELAIEAVYPGAHHDGPLTQCEKRVAEAIAAAREEGRHEAIEECAKIVRVRDRPTDMLVRINALKLGKE